MVIQEQEAKHNEKMSYILHFYSDRRADAERTSRTWRSRDI